SADYRLAVDLERQRRAENRKAMGVIVGTVDRIEHPAVRGALRGGLLTELFGENRVIGKALGDHLAEHRLDGDIGLADEVDCSFLGDMESARQERCLNFAGFDHGFDRGTEQKWIHRCFSIRISMPPCRARWISTWSMN